MGSQLTDLVRKKYPGMYDDMSDDDLEKSVLEKHPEYQDLASPPKSTDLPGGAKPVEKIESYEDTANKESNPLKAAVGAVKAVGDSDIVTNPLHAARSAYDVGSGLLDKFVSPTWEGPTRAGNALAEKINPTTHPTEDLGVSGLFKGNILGDLATGITQHPWETFKGGLAGLSHGAGEQASGLTSPLNIATSLLGMGASGAEASEAIPEVAGMLRKASRVAHVPMLLHGVRQAVTGDSLSDKANGLLEAVLGWHGANAGHVNPVGEVANDGQTRLRDRTIYADDNGPNGGGPSGPSGPDFGRLGPDQTNAQPMNPSVLDGLRETLARVQAQGPDFKTSNEPISPDTPGLLTADEVKRLRKQNYSDALISRIQDESIKAAKGQSNPLENKVGFPEQALPPDMIQQGGEGAYNAVHGPDNPLTPSPADAARKLTEDAVDRLRGPRDFSRQNPMTEGPDVRDLAPKGRGVPQDLGPVAGDENPLSPIEHPNYSDENPSFARAKGGGFVINADIKRATQNLTKDYSGALSGIMVREGMQNALDAADKLGEEGHVKVRVLRDGGDGSPAIEIHDNGSGLDQKGLEDKLFTLFASGKSDDPNATGGKGIGSASYIAGGKHFEIETVAVDATDGKKYRITASGTPEQFQDPNQGSEWNREEVPQSTPTGTRIKTTLNPEQDRWDAKEMVNKVIEHTRDRASKVTYDTSGWGKEPISEMKGVSPNSDEDTISRPNAIEDRFKSSKDDKLIGKLNVGNGNNEVRIQIPKYEGNEEHESIMVHHLNNGMYQFSNYKGLEKKAAVPPHVIVDTHPLVDEMHNDYPFINTREDMKTAMKKPIDDFITKHITAPALEEKKNRTQELYDSMPQVGQGFRKTVIFDPGKRLTPDETEMFTNSPAIKQLNDHYDGLLNNILKTTGRTAWADRLEGVGIAMDPNLHGVHIPNPATGKSTILFNPFARMEGGQIPSDNAYNSVITALHEAAHIGKEAGSSTDVRFDPKDLQDPRIGKFMASYAEQAHQHGDVGYNSTGHEMGFIHRLGEIFAKFGPDRTFKSADALEKIFTGGKYNGQYSPEFQKLLDVYQESRGRSATTEDLLSPTGVKQEGRQPTDAGNVKGPTSGATPAIQQLSDTLKNDPNSGPEVAKKFNQLGRLAGSESNKEKLWKNASDVANLPRAIMTSYDISGPGRQGLPLALNKEYWTSMDDMIKSWGSDKAYQAVKQSIMDHPNFQPGPDGTSLAERAGLKFSGNEEQFQSHIAEAIPGIARSERAYNGFLGKLRADTFNRMVDDYRAAGQDPARDDVLLRGIGKFINDATGRGTMGKNFEAALPVLSQTFFAPRLVASRINMYRTLLNPLTYASEDPVMRKQALKSLLAITGIGQTMGSLAKYGGATVSTDPNNPDFGKIKVGNTRIDPFAGFQQYATAASRIISGRSVSSYTGRTTDLDSGRFGKKTRADIAQQFVMSKLAPIPSFVWGMMSGKNWDGTSFDAKKAIAERMIPLAVQDLKDIWSQDPKSFPAGTFAGAFPNVTKAALSVAPIVGLGAQTYGR